MNYTDPLISAPFGSSRGRRTSVAPVCPVSPPADLHQDPALRHPGSPHVFPETPPYHSPQPGPGLTSPVRHAGASSVCSQLRRRTLLHGKDFKFTVKSPSEEQPESVGKKQTDTAADHHRVCWGCGDECRPIEKAFNSGLLLWSGN